MTSSCPAGQVVCLFALGCMARILPGQGKAQLLANRNLPNACLSADPAAAVCGAGDPGQQAGVAAGAQARQHPALENPTAVVVSLYLYSYCIVRKSRYVSAPLYSASVN